MSLILKKEGGDARAWYMLDGQDSSTLSRTLQLQVKNRRPG